MTFMKQSCVCVVPDGHSAANKCVYGAFSFSLKWRSHEG